MSRAKALGLLADRVLEAPDVSSLAVLLTRELPQALDAADATLLLWDRKLDSFEVFAPGQTRTQALRPGEMQTAAPEARYLISDGQLLETAGGKGDGALLPLMARSGLAGMIVLGPRRGRRQVAYQPAELRALTLVATRAALALENHLYLRELVASERMAALGTMAGMLAHDFRGPMTVIRGYAETLVVGEIPEPEIKARAELIVQAVDRLERMTGETLDFARGGGLVARRPTLVPAAFEAMAQGIGEELPGLTIVRDFALPETTVLIDLDKVRRAISNIAANARDAMGGGGRFRIGARLEEGRLLILLADEGPGIPPEIRDRLFEPFVTQGKKGGTGLGLAVARRFVEDHGGTIALEAEGPGARFRIALPL
jgi:signal transduction histidine kinase